MTAVAVPAQRVTAHRSLLPLVSVATSGWTATNFVGFVQRLMFSTDLAEYVERSGACLCQSLPESRREFIINGSKLPRALPLTRGRTSTHAQFSRPACTSKCAAGNRVAHKVHDIQHRSCVQCTAPSARTQRSWKPLQGQYLKTHLQQRDMSPMHRHSKAHICTLA